MFYCKAQLKRFKHVKQRAKCSQKWRALSRLNDHTTSQSHSNLYLTEILRVGNIHLSPNNNLFLVQKKSFSWMMQIMSNLEYSYCFDPVKGGNNASKTELFQQNKPHRTQLCFFLSLPDRTRRHQTYDTQPQHFCRWHTFVIYLSQAVDKMAVKWTRRQ